MNAISFIGMPGCGKSTISRAVATRLGAAWYDTDAEIELRYGTTVAEIFASMGEDAFRCEETAVISELLTAPRSGMLLLSLGGGAVLRNEPLIRKHSRVVYIQRDVARIYASLTVQPHFRAGLRPLARSLADLERTYEARHEIYERMTDVIIDNNGTAEEAITQCVFLLSTDQT